MKNQSFLLSLLFVGLIAYSCNKDVQTHIGYDSYEWASEDLDGGDWQQVVIPADKNFDVRHRLNPV
ncbi:MAG: hypothetical protein IPP37_01425 [Saprospiraceae bacterium]|nr:hypothetical protein [Saprospiraceae bacterium]